ncbi:UNVERIFIED_CONTAM: hypothetical protein FKN15_047147 [Acipenser sinensis]
MFAYRRTNLDYCLVKIRDETGHWSTPAVLYCFLWPELNLFLNILSLGSTRLLLDGIFKLWNLAIGIGIQNFPEGLAVSLPLRGAGMSTWKAFWYGQLSGMVEPVAGVLGAFAVVVAEPLLPYALAFAAGAMVYVVVDDIIPEAQVR